MKKTLLFISIYLLGCVVSYPINKWVVMRGDRRDYPTLYSYGYEKSEKETTLAFCVCSWLGPIADGIIGLMWEIGDGISSPPKW